MGENVINQGLFHLDWLMDHKAEFKLLVLDKLGAAAAEAIDWSAPRVFCRGIGHWGTGNLEVPITSQADLDAVKPFINAAYEEKG